MPKMVLKSGDNPRQPTRAKNDSTNSNDSIDFDYEKGDPKLLMSSHPCLQLKTLPPLVRKRIKALKKLQVEHTQIEAEFYSEVHKLECKYSQLYSGIYQKRRLFVTGDKEPTDQEADFTLDATLDGPGDSEDDEQQTGVSPYGDIAANAKGIPYFWLTIFRNVEALNDMVQPDDEKVLKHLVDIEVELLESEPMGFILKFVFSPNPYFSNSVLTKFYEMRCKPEDDDPFSFEGPEIFKCEGCTIDWHKDQDVTRKIVKKKQKHKNTSQMRTVHKVVEHDSFFNFFNPPVLDENAEEVDSDIMGILNSDFEIGHYIRERIVPYAVLYYTGEALEEEEEMGSEEEDDEGESTDESDDQEGGGKVGNTDAAPECKQQ